MPTYDWEILFQHFDLTATSVIIMVKVFEVFSFNVGNFFFCYQVGIRELSFPFMQEKPPVQNIPVTATVS